MGSESECAPRVCKRLKGFKMVASFDLNDL